MTRILARLPRCMGMLAKILARSCQDLTKATMIMQDHGKADHASYQAYQDFPCILPSFSMCLAKLTKIFLSILPIQPGFFHAFCKAFQDFRCNLQSLIRSTCVFEPFEILYLETFQNMKHEKLRKKQKLRYSKTVVLIWKKLECSNNFAIIIASPL